MVSLRYKKTLATLHKKSGSPLNLSSSRTENNLTFFSRVFSFLTGLSSLLEPSGFWSLALPVGVCSSERNNK